MTKFQKLFSFDGRIGRQDYIVYILLSTLLPIAIMGVLAAMLYLAGFHIDAEIISRVWKLGVLLLTIFVVIYWSFITWTWLELSAKRLHDVNLSGGWLLLILVPFVNLALQIFLCLQKGDPIENAFGPLPPYRKEPEILVA